MSATATNPQHMDALATANRVRLEACDVKREVRAGQITVADALTDPRAGALTIGALLCAQNRWGHTRMRRLLASALGGWLLEERRVRDLTDRQRRALTDAMEGRW